MEAALAQAGIGPERIELIMLEAEVKTSLMPLDRHSARSLKRL